MIVGVKLQDHHPHDGFDRVAAALENARQAAGLALEMKAQRQFVHVHESAEGQPAHRVHRHLGEGAVAQLRQHRHQDAHAAVSDGQGDRRGHRPEQPVGRSHWRTAGAGQRVGRPFEGERHKDGRELGRQQQTKRAQHPQLQIAPIRRPDVGPEVDDGRKQRAAVGGDLRRRLGAMMVVMVRHSDPGKDGGISRRRSPSYRGIPGGRHPPDRISQA